MKDMVKKYLPYVAVIFAVYIVVPLIFRNGVMANYVGIAWYFLFPATAVVSAAVYCSKYGMDFLFSLIAPIFFLPSMFLFYGGVSLFNILMLAIYLIAGIFGLFIGDIALGDKRKAREEKEKAQAEEMLLEAKRIDEKAKEIASNNNAAAPKRNPVNRSRSSRKPAPRKNNHQTSQTIATSDDDDSYFDKYISEIDRKPVNSTESEIDDILSEFGH